MWRQTQLYIEHYWTLVLHSELQCLHLRIGCKWHSDSSILVGYKWYSLIGRMLEKPETKHLVLYKCRLPNNKATPLFFLGGGQHSNSKFLEPYGWAHDMYLIDSPWFCWVFDGFWMDLVGFLIDRESVWILYHALWTRSEHEFFWQY